MVQSTEVFRSPASFSTGSRCLVICPSFSLLQIISLRLSYRRNNRCVCTSGSGQTEQVRERMRKQVADRGSFEHEKLEQPHLARSSGARVRWEQQRAGQPSRTHRQTDGRQERRTAEITGCRAHFHRGRVKYPRWLSQKGVQEQRRAAFTQEGSEESVSSDVN